VGVTVRELGPGDRLQVRDALLACGAFTEEEVRVALEVLDAGLSGGLDGDYPLFAAEVQGRVRGYVCVGKTPLTQGTWHLYWICVHPIAQGRGIGRALQAHAEAFVRARGGERLVLETSASPGYARARGFYDGAGYTVVGRIPDFYRPGDDCILYCKALGPAAS
jgi:ribosomal protein S18 acetylase RimI-like enzyme